MILVHDAPIELVSDDGQDGWRVVSQPILEEERDEDIAYKSD